MAMWMSFTGHIMWVSVQIWIAFLLITLCTTIYGLFRRRWLMQKLTANFDDCGLKTSFIWGNSKCYPSANTKEYLDKVNQVFGRMTNYGRDWIGPFLCNIQVVSPEYIKIVFANSDSKDSLFNNILRPWTGDALNFTKGAKWKRLRRLFTPFFQTSILKQYIKIYVDSTEIFLDKISDTKGRSVDVFGYVKRLTLDIAYKYMYSYESNCQLNEENVYIKAHNTFLEIYMERLTFPPYLFEPIFHLLPSGFKWRRCLRVILKKPKEEIKKRRLKFKEMEDHGHSEHSEEENRDFLDMLFHATDKNGEGLTDQEICDEVANVMHAGYHNISVAISWCLYNFGRFPDYQRKCYEEVQKLFEEKGNTKLEWDDLKSLPFTTMFIKESLRFHAPVPAILRKLLQDVTFPDGTVLPKGTSVVVSPLATHHHPLYWENPEVFDPYRFLPERSKDRHSYAYIPFSAGPRNCLGKNFTMNEIKVAIAMTVHRFQIDVDPDKTPEWSQRIILTSLNGIHLKFYPR
ncbi:cytochrome P450 4F4-like [Amphiura filiformis]|uniref:cytochrome P450 4F4-like n=1 Tax=Amphiura filiformis TaxID=82378 RepID=UPI003B228873